MSAVAVLIADMVRAGVDPDLIGRTAELLSCDDQAERRRAADRDRKRAARLSAVSAESAESADSAPHPPALDKENPPAPPEEINPTPLTPQAALQSGREGEKSDLESLTDRLLEVVGEKIQPHGAIVLAPILGLIDGGCDLETDILPTIRARAAKLTRPAGSWAYFVPAIREAYETRIAAGRGLSRPKPVKRVDDMTDDEQRQRWIKFLNMARGSGIWLTWMHGPPPGREGCRVPPDLLEARDAKIDWFEEKRAA